MIGSRWNNAEWPNLVWALRRICPRVRASGSWRNFLISGFFVEKKPDTAINCRAQPAARAVYGFFFAWPAQLSCVWIFIWQNRASSCVWIFRPRQCQDFSQHCACSEMQLQSNFIGFCMILAWLRSCVRDYFFAWPAGLNCVRIYFSHGHLG